MEQRERAAAATQRRRELQAAARQNVVETLHYPGEGLAASLSQAELAFVA